MWFRGLLGYSGRRAFHTGWQISWEGSGFSRENTASLAFYTAVDMCGNEGQVSIIDQMGIDAFMQAVSEALEEGDAVDALLGLCPYPEAVGEILEEAGGVINDIVGDVLDRRNSDDADDDWEYEDDEEFEDDWEFEEGGEYEG